MIRVVPSLAVFAAVLATSFAFGQFVDDFERPDGPPDGWLPYQHNWVIESGGLVGTAAGGGAAGEAWAWAGDPPIRIVGDFTATFTIDFPVPSPEVGKHGGFSFFASEPTQRWATTWSGYTLDWIDRPDDFGFRLIRWDNGVASNLVIGTPTFFAPPFEWTIEVDGDLIRLFGDGDLAFEVSDSTYRSGHFGFWIYGTGAQIRYDDVEVQTGPVQPCFTMAPDRGTAPLTVEFDASCSTAGGSIASYTWDFGDGESGAGATVSHTYTIPDIYTVTLTVEDTTGNSAEATSVVRVFEPADDAFVDDFERADGAVDGWSVGQGDWNLASGFLATTTAGVESWIWAGEPGIVFSGDLDIDVSLTYLTTPPDEVGRHAGIMIFAGSPTIRTNNTGYTIDWIDRPRDRGFRISRWDGVGETLLFSGDGGLVEPPEEWRVVVQNDVIFIIVEGEVIGGARDATYREGFFGFWAYSNGQSINVDQVSVATLEEPLTTAVSPCFDAPAAGATGFAVTFDAACTASVAEIVSYEWDFGDGDTAEGLSVQHTYEIGDLYTVTLTVTDAVGTERSISQTIDVFDYEGDLVDDFERADGFPDGWTIYGGDWQLLGGALSLQANPNDAWIWAGSPAQRFPANFEATFRYEFLTTPPDVVGRHGGVMFAAAAPTHRSDTLSSGYTIDWIDRADDHGFRLIRFDNATATVLQNGTPQIAEPPAEWTVRVQGDTISLIVDGEPIFEIVDTTYRTGHFGFWAYINGPTIAIDDVEIRGLDGGGEPEGPFFVRGDADGFGGLNLTDGIFILNYLFVGNVSPMCNEALDSDDNDSLNLTDGIYVLSYLFSGGPPPAAPFPDCGIDPREGEAADCDSFPGCE